MVGTSAATYSPYLQNLSWLDENNEEHQSEFSHGEDGGDAAPVMVGTNAATYSPYLQNLSWLDANNEEHQSEFSHGEDGGDAAPMMDGTSSNTFSPFLQNLAFLGADGKVHSVNQGLKGIDGAPHLLGATAPLVGAKGAGIPISEPIMVGTSAATYTPNHLIGFY